MSSLRIIMATMRVIMSKVSCEHCSDPVCDVVWLQSKTGQELMTASTDGCVLWWDARNLAQPQETLVLKVATCCPICPRHMQHILGTWRGCGVGRLVL